MRRFARDNGLSLFFFAIFVAALAGQAIAGHADFNHQQVAHHGQQISFLRYLVSNDFAANVTENWQSEYLQFTLFVVTAVWLVQRGSTESKAPGEEGGESDEAQLVGEHARPDSPAWARARGVRTAIYSNSLLIAMLAIFLASWFVQSLTGHVAYNAEQLDHQEAPVSWVAYLGTADFWDRTLQNWQSEFLAVGSMAVFSVYLRQRGSPQSKPVGASHEVTGVEG
jgi:hypothetical protein